MECSIHDEHDDTKTVSISILQKFLGFFLAGPRELSPTPKVVPPDLIYEEPYNQTDFTFDSNMGMNNTIYITSKKFEIKIFLRPY
jgi:hypothetical protein